MSLGLQAIAKRAISEIASAALTSPGSITYLVGLEVSSGFYSDIASSVLRLHIERRLASTLQPLEDGRLTLELDNASAKFSPSNAASPYYPNLAPGRSIRVQATCQGSTYNLFQGRVLEYKLMPGLGQRKTLVEAADAAVRLRETVITTSLFINANPASLFTGIMSLSNVASFSSDIFYDTIPYAWFQDISASEAIQRIAEFGSYSVYIDPAGTIQLRNRYFGLNAVSAASYAAVGTDGYFSLDYALNAESIINRARVSGQARRAATSQQTVAWLADRPTISASSHLGFWVAYVDPDSVTVPSPATSLQAPVSSLDWQLNTASDGTGTDRTATGSINVTLFGAAAVCSLFNGSSDTVYLTKFQVRGFSIQQQPHVTVQHDNSSSQNVYGRREFLLDSEFIGTQDYAASYAKSLVDSRKEPIPDISLTLNNVFPDVLARDLGQVLSLVESHSAVNSQWSVTSIEHEVRLDSGLEHVTTMGVKFYSNKPWLILDDPIQGVINGDRELAF